MGIGVHFGPVVAGNIGTLEHAQYTIIGDTVNLASRLESATRELAVDVLVSAAAATAAGAGAPALTSRGMLAVRGRDEAVEVFTFAP
jgi:adenylate cyclase